MQADEQARRIAEAVEAEVLNLLVSGGNWTLTVHGAASGRDVKLDVRRVANLVMLSPRAEADRVNG